MRRRVLAVDRVTKVFEEGRQRVPVLKGITMAVAAGEVVALEGPSGSGKTTLLSIAGCILSPTSGEVEVAGRRVRRSDAAALREVRRRSIGFVFQQYNLFPALSAVENVEYSLNVRGVGGRAAREEAERVLGRVGLGDRLHFLPRDLSGGQKQRVAIARALAGSPPVVLADEPTANLDTAVGGQVLDLFRELATGEQKGVLVVTHDPKVRRIADRVVGIRDGMLVGEDGTPRTVDGGEDGAPRSDDGAEVAA
jgi:putative ABC transport system ATP-binding protein